MNKFFMRKCANGFGYSVAGTSAGIPLSDYIKYNMDHGLDPLDMTANFNGVVPMPENLRNTQFGKKQDARNRHIMYSKLSPIYNQARYEEAGYNPIGPQYDTTMPVDIDGPKHNSILGDLLAPMHAVAYNTPMNPKAARFTERSLFGPGGKLYGYDNYVADPLERRAGTALRSILRGNADMSNPEVAHGLDQFGQAIQDAFNRK